MAQNTKTKTDVPAEAIDEPTELEVARDAEAEENELLADMPALTAPEKLRIRHKNRLKRISIAAAPTLDRVREARERGEEPGTELVEMVLVITEEIDDFAESIADDPEAYAEWSGGKDTEHMMALFSRYMRASGE